MSLLHLILLAIIQGLTEFLPISSSAHLILPAQIFGWPDQGPMIDLMAHFGTLFAVLLYFRKDVADMIAGFFELLRRNLTPRSALALNLILATPPALLVGAYFSFAGLDEALRQVWIIALTSIVFGVVLWWADIKFPRRQSAEELSWKGAVLMGAAQALALIPGTSRSGITMTAGRMMALTRVEAARFSMLMSLPIIGAGGLFSAYKLMSDGSSAGPGLQAGVIVAGLSFFTAYLSIAFFMKLVSRIGMFPFMVYRLLLGGALLVWLVTLGQG